VNLLFSELLVSYNEGKKLYDSDFRQLIYTVLANCADNVEWIHRTKVRKQVVWRFRCRQYALADIDSCCDGGSGLSSHVACHAGACCESGEKWTSSFGVYTTDYFHHWTPR
jgi:hypothetical protein